MFFFSFFFLVLPHCVGLCWEGAVGSKRPQTGGVLIPDPYVGSCEVGERQLLGGPGVDPLTLLVPQGDRGFWGGGRWSSAAPPSRQGAPSPRGARPGASLGGAAAAQAQ